MLSVVYGWRCFIIFPIIINGDDSLQFVSMEKYPLIQLPESF